MKKQGWSVAKVRRTWAQGTVGKAIAVLLAVAMVLPAFATVPSGLVSVRGGGVNSVNNCDKLFCFVARYLTASLLLACLTTQDPINQDPINQKPLLFPPAPLGSGTPYP